LDNLFPGIHAQRSLETQYLLINLTRPGQWPRAFFQALRFEGFFDFPLEEKVLERIQVVPREFIAVLPLGKLAAGLLPLRHAETPRVDQAAVVDVFDGLFRGALYPFGLRIRKFAP